MNLEMSQAIREKLESLSEASDCTLADVIRRALAVYHLLRTETQKGSKLLIRDEDGDREVMIV
jgi:hypothetical protein